MKRRFGYYYFILILILFSLIKCTSHFSEKRKPLVTKGVLDLRNWDFKEDGMVSLDGDWEFYWKEHLLGSDFDLDKFKYKKKYFYVPNVWNRYKIYNKKLPAYGYATYRMTILLKDRQPISLRLPVVKTAYDLFLNNKKVASAGRVGKRPADSKANYTTKVISYLPDSQSVEVVFHVSNYYLNTGGINCDMLIGKRKSVSMSYQWMIFYYIVTFAITFIMGFYYLTFFLIRRSDKSLLYFSIFCFLSSLFTMLLDNNFFHYLISDIQWELGAYIIFGSLFLTLPVFILFTYQVFPDELSKRIVHILLGCSLFIIILLFLFPPHLSSFSLNIFVFIYCFSNLYLIYVYIIAKFRKRPGARILFFGYLIFFISLINDLLNYHGYLHNGFLAPLGAVALILAHSHHLKVKYVKSFEKVADLSRQLEMKNVKLLELDHLKDEFLANTSHELRTPLHAISGLTESLLDGSHGEVSENVTHHLSLIALSSRRLTNLVNDILDFSKLKHRDIRLNMTGVDLKVLCDVLIEYFKPLVNEKNIYLKNNVKKDFPCILADENRLQQILFNLIGNAVKFTDKGGITISAELAEKKKDKKQFACIIVNDTGVGIEQDKLDQVFENYEQAHSADCECTGTGIGLSIVKRLVELHGGSIEVMSKKGSGSSFRFSLQTMEDKVSLPKKKRKSICCDYIQDYKISHKMNLQNKDVISKNFVNPADFTETTGNGNILVVDDEQVNLIVIKNYFHGKNYQLEMVNSGSRAVQLISEKNYDLVLLDIMMPGMSGYEVCRIIREKFSAYELPVIMLTAKDNISDMVTGFEAGANDYLVKPIHKEELLVRVRNFVTLRKMVKEHKEAKFKLLQERMRPHFLFNALNTIHALLYTNHTEADKAILKLSEIYRFLTEKSYQDLINFEDEWSFVTGYMEIEKLQYGEDLGIKIVKKGEFTRIEIPPQTIQPLVENCFKHGLKYIEDRGEIELSAERKNKKIKILVKDNGKGISGNIDFNRSLGNIQKRLKYYFDNVSVKLSNNLKRGVSAEIKFELKEDS